MCITTECGVQHDGNGAVVVMETAGRRCGVQWSRVLVLEDPSGDFVAQGLRSLSATLHVGGERGTISLTSS